MKGKILPKNYHEAKKIIWDLGFYYKKFDVCKNECTLYSGDNANVERCAKCGESGWNSDNVSKGNKKIRHKYLRYFLLKPRLQILFLSSKITSSMRWHHEECPNDGKLRQPADAKA